MLVARSDINMEDLARRMSSLEEEAFLEFAAVFGPRFRKLFLNRGLNLTDAEDLAVSCVTDIALKVGQYRTTHGHFEAWVFTVARHYLIDWWRRQHPGVQLSDDSPIVPLSNEKLELNPEVVSAVRESVQRLSESDRTIIQMRNMEGECTFAEVGKQLGITAGAARVRHLRALQRLEELLERDVRIDEYLERIRVIHKEK